MSAARVWVFVDGFNMYYGLKDAELGHLRWLDYVALARRLNTSDARNVTCVSYYTARVLNDHEAAERQSVYIDALRSMYHDDELKIIEGRMQPEPKTCHADCGKEFELLVEKNTDVNLATDMVVGAYKEFYDEAMLISGDADQVAAVKAVQATGRYVRVVFPPKRENYQLREAVRGPLGTSYSINPDHLAQCQLPPSIQHRDHPWLTLQRPPSWG